MRISRVSFGLAALALVAAPAIAQSALAPRVAPLSGNEQGQSEGGGSGLILGILGGAAVIGAIIIASDDDGAELPVSG
jgi:hypothetical protein